MTAANVGTITLEYESIGEGPALLLVMGLGGQLIDWPDEFVNIIADRGFQVIRFDNRDAGLSSQMSGAAPTVKQMMSAQVSRRFAKADYLISDMARDTIGLLDHLDIASAHVVGASMGGMIAQTIAIEHPTRVKSLVSIMSNTGDRRHGRPSVALLRKMRKYMATEPETRMENAIAGLRLISGPHFDEQAARELLHRRLERSDDVAGAGRQFMATSASPDRTPGLRRLNVPTLVIHGLVDRLVMPSGGVTTTKAVHGSRLLMFPDMGHDLPRPRWQEVIDAIVANTQRSAPIARSTS
jgi:pimeloyl-ACP methyl ester carboxylesterase